LHGVGAPGFILNCAHAPRPRQARPKAGAARER